MQLRSILSCLLLILFAADAASAQDDPKKMPREDVVEVPAIGKGLCVSNVFQTNMVIQRDKPVSIWGWAAPGEKVTVSFATQQASAVAAKDRSWKVTLKPEPASWKPQVITVKGKDATLTVKNILVGDVWILGGQSNMEFPIRNVVDGQLEIVSANFPQIRLLTPPRGKKFDSVASFERLYEWSDWSSRHFRKGDWEVCTPKTVSEFSAIGYVFGRRMALATRVPIGLIDTSQGGTTVEAWTPADVVKKIEGKETKAMLKDWQDRIDEFDPQKDLAGQIARYENRVKKYKDQGKPVPSHFKRPTKPRPGPVADKNRPGCRYASTIRPFEGLSVKGAVFHQGYNNCFKGSEGSRMYYQVFGSMITAWRKAFADENLPFCIISLCTAGEPQTSENFTQRMGDIGALIREAQYKTFRDLYDADDKSIGFVSSFDQRKRSYHPQIKIPVGERAAKWALATQHELPVKMSGEAWLPPTIKEVKVADGAIQLNMSTNMTTGDDSDGKMLGFAIAGEDRRFHPAEVNYYTDGTKDKRKRLQYKKNILTLTSPMVPKPVHYRYAWARNPMANITNSAGVPLATQRSDNWRSEETPTKFPIPPGTDARSYARQLRNLLNTELGLLDTHRRISQAEALLAELKEKYKTDQAAWEKRKAKEFEKASQPRDPK
ncbi:MAG: sialate O-acetylesterase [Phycisphaerae bacterium]|jgi:sialate O-acetylesterase|nr:sialate O-acetylesterase [Phycisphaerae bacterium]